MDDGGRTAPKLRHPPVWPRRAVLRPGGATGRDQGAREVNRTWRLLLRLRSAAQAEEEATATRACSFGGGLGPSRGPGGTLPAPPAIVVGRRSKGLLGDPCPTATLSLLRPTLPSLRARRGRSHRSAHEPAYVRRQRPSPEGRRPSATKASPRVPVGAPRAGTHHTAAGWLSARPIGGSWTGPWPPDRRIVRVQNESHRHSVNANAHSRLRSAARNGTCGATSRPHGYWRRGIRRSLCRQSPEAG